ncbi:unnamed protein product [Somion occarium]|uniref:acylaminoacyl-peptidase n=1 Tax=Somion occarium TaxID=3059160 RepID=A0ABP1CUT8_9APHY
MSLLDEAHWTSHVPNSAVYRELSVLPSYTASQFQASNVIRIASSTNDHVRNVKRQNLQTFVIKGDDVIVSPATDLVDVVKSAISPSRKWIAILREIQDNSTPDGKKRFVEVWSRDKLEISFDATKSHGAFYGDEIFSSLSFSPSENALIYIAEIQADGPKESEASPLSKYTYTPELGEGYAGKKRPGIFVFRWDAEHRDALPAVHLLRPKELPSQPTLFTQAVFATNDRIFAIGHEYTADERLLGLKFCTNRAACIWDFALPSEDNTAEVLLCEAWKRTQSSRSARCPRVHIVDGKPLSLVWMSNPVGGPHASCSTLHRHNFATNDWSDQIIVESVTDPKPDKFPGIFASLLPTEPFVQLSTSESSETFVAISSAWRSRGVVVLISLESGKVINLNPDDAEYHFSWSVLATDGGNQLVVVCSAPTTPQEVLLGKITNDRHVHWQVLVKPDLSDSLREGLASLKTSIIPIPHRYPIETVVLGPKDGSSRACITNPHGGPHGSSTTLFNIFNAVFALEGYTISMPLYTGSVGYGEMYIQKLLGRIGDLDVQDCLETVKYLSTLGITELGPGKQFLFGGSHGGFLIGHLIGQFPDVFSASVLRNPVISLGEISTSDIPDWYYEEAGLPFHAESLMTPEAYSKLYQMSPIAYVDRVQSPVLLGVGEKDLRVAPTQSKAYFHALKAQGVEAGGITADASLALFNKYRK